MFSGMFHRFCNTLTHLCSSLANGIVVFILCTVFFPQRGPPVVCREILLRLFADITQVTQAVL